MAHAADFADAHSRHWEDAELLRDNGRWANADQLYGFSAECGLKAVMLALGMDVHPTTGAPKGQHKQHLPRIWPVFEEFAGGRDGERYLRLLPGDIPFADWSTDDRYANRTHFRETDVSPHRQAAHAIRGMVESLAQDPLP